MPGRGWSVEGFGERGNRKGGIRGRGREMRGGGGGLRGGCDVGGERR